MHNKFVEEAKLLMRNSFNKLQFHIPGCFNAVRGKKFAIFSNNRWNICSFCANFYFKVFPRGGWSTKLSVVAAIWLIIPKRSQCYKNLSMKTFNAKDCVQFPCLNFLNVLFLVMLCCIPRQCIKTSFDYRFLDIIGIL